MYFIALHYIQPLEQVDRHVSAHRAYLERHYASGHFLLSGRKEPRTGGVILAQAKDRGELDAILAQDPFALAQVAEYTITEFIPSMAAGPFASLVA